MGFGMTVATGPLRVLAFSIGVLDSAGDLEYNVFVIDIEGFVKADTSGLQFSGNFTDPY